MALRGGRTPYDEAGALSGPARTLWAPQSAAVPTANLWDIVEPVRDTDGEYPSVGDWEDFGLAADAPSYTHSRETEGLEYQQPAGELFQQISNVSRNFTAQIAGITPENLRVVENAQAANVAVAAGAGVSALAAVPLGLYDKLESYRICLVSYRPNGSAVVTEPGGFTRPPAVALILPLVTLAAEDAEFSFERGTPVNAAISFEVISEPTLPTTSAHGWWVFETPGVIAAA